MRQGTIFSIYLSLTVLLATVFSQQPERASEAEKSDPAVVVVQARLEGFLPQVIASLTTRYQLGTAAGIPLGQTLRESIATALKQPQLAKRLTAVSSTYEADGKLLEVLLSHPPCRAALARHLSPAQLQDYVQFINRWGRRGRQAAARRMTAWLDGRLLLSGAQRQQVEQLLVRSTQEDLVDLLWSEPAAWQPLHDIHGRTSFLSRLSRESPGAGASCSCCRTSLASAAAKSCRDARDATTWSRCACCLLSSSRRRPGWFGCATRRPGP